MTEEIEKVNEIIENIENKGGCGDNKFTCLGCPMSHICDIYYSGKDTLRLARSWIKNNAPYNPSSLPIGAK